MEDVGGEVVGGKVVELRLETEETLLYGKSRKTQVVQINPQIKIWVHGPNKL